MKASLKFLRKLVPPWRKVGECGSSRITYQYGRNSFRMGHGKRLALLTNRLMANTPAFFASPSLPKKIRKFHKPLISDGRSATTMPSWRSRPWKRRSATS